MLENFKNFLQTNTDITDVQFEQIGMGLKCEKVEKGKLLLKENQVCTHSFFVETGLLRAYTLDENGKEHIIQFAPEKWIISDRSSAYFDAPSQLYIDVIEDAEIIYLEKDFVSKISEISPSFRMENERLLHNHIRHLQTRINLLISASAEKRYMHFIELYPDLLLRVPLWMIASYLGITPESLSRVRKELARRNFKPNSK
ncbi:Crp/Fnr family transcriptional regulator [Gillisia sp. M10.2A]|uniref:Crp/Fnr family transcriptional regulator n=1 Tax=Gillisia lutea TaxID=2909668 RepID=A0ABS9EFI7_9FLAO|nr:Crp/Fnr family transcriptional regulator [Gillisia lutea]MCF4100545.1 Crp/Fnr family transcriptional regulator [Gillisia lutea]